MHLPTHTCSLRTLHDFLYSERSLFVYQYRFKYLRACMRVCVCARVQCEIPRDAPWSNGHDNRGWSKKGCILRATERTRATRTHTSAHLSENGHDTRQIDVVEPEQRRMILLYKIR